MLWPTEAQSVPFPPACLHSQRFAPPLWRTSLLKDFWSCCWTCIPGLLVITCFISQGCLVQKAVQENNTNLSTGPLVITAVFASSNWKDTEFQGHPGGVFFIFLSCFLDLKVTPSGRFTVSPQEVPRTTLAHEVMSLYLGAYSNCISHFSLISRILTYNR